MAKGKGPVMVNVRLRPPAGARVTKQVLGDVLDELRDGQVRPGWSFAAIEWMNPKGATKGWRRGTAEDLERFLPVLRKVSKADLLESFRAAEVEPHEPRSGKQRRRAVVLQARADRWHRARAKEVQARDKLKTRGARVRHERKAEAYRKRYQRAIEALEALDYPEDREFELAVDYKGRKGRR